MFYSHKGHHLECTATVDGAEVQVSFNTQHSEDWNCTGVHMPHDYKKVDDVSELLSSRAWVIITEAIEKSVKEVWA